MDQKIRGGAPARTVAGPERRLALGCPEALPWAGMPDAAGREGAPRGTWALYLGTAAVYADMFVTQPFLPLLTDEFGVPPARAGLTVSAVVLAIALASSLHGPLGDALGRKR